MTSPASAIRVPDLTKLDELELRKQLGNDSVKFEKDKQGDEIHGEIATATAIVIVSLAALRTLSVYLVKAHKRKKFRRRMEIVRADGSRKIVEIEYSGSSSEEPEAEVLKQLAEACDVDAKGLAKL